MHPFQFPGKSTTCLPVAFFAFSSLMPIMFSSGFALMLYMISRYTIPFTALIQWVIMTMILSATSLESLTLDNCIYYVTLFFSNTVSMRNGSSEVKEIVPLPRLGVVTTATDALPSVPPDKLEEKSTTDHQGSIVQPMSPTVVYTTPSNDLIASSSPVTVAPLCTPPATPEMKPVSPESTLPESDDQSQVQADSIETLGSTSCNLTNNRVTSASLSDSTATPPFNSVTKSNDYTQDEELDDTKHDWVTVVYTKKKRRSAKVAPLVKNRSHPKPLGGPRPLQASQSESYRPTPTHTRLPVKSQSSKVHTQAPSTVYKQDKRRQQHQQQQPIEQNIHPKQYISHTVETPRRSRFLGDRDKGSLAWQSRSNAFDAVYSPFLTGFDIDIGRCCAVNKQEDCRSVNVCNTTRFHKAHAHQDSLFAYTPNPFGTVGENRPMMSLWSQPYLEKCFSSSEDEQLKSMDPV